MRPYFNRPEFWATHYDLVIGTEDRDAESFLEPFFGVDPDAVFEFSENELVKPDGTFELLPVEVSDEASVAVEFVDCGDDGNELRYYITLSAWDDWELVGYDSPHFALPAFRWPELCAMGQRSATAFLLVLPSVWLEPDDQNEATIERIENEWRLLGIVEASATRQLAQQIVDNLSDRDVHWFEDARHGWINDGRYSFRNPETRMTEYSETRFQRIREFFRSLG